MDKRKQTNNELQHITQTNKDQAKPGVNSGAPEGLSVPATHVAPVM